MAMSDKGARHHIAFIITVIALAAFLGGYFSGIFGWWWTGFALLIIYGGVYSAIK